MSAREIVLSVINASQRPLKREDVVAIVHNEYQHLCHEGTVFKWLSQLTLQGRIAKLGPGLYANHHAAEVWRKEENGA